MPTDNLILWWNRSSKMDREYGHEAYWTYRNDIHGVLSGHPVEAWQGYAAFALLSPNNDYAGNLRCLRIVVDGFQKGYPVAQLKGLTTYRQCAARAYRVLAGELPDEVFGRTAHKTYNFYHNIDNPLDARFVTIDGHMHNLWRGERTTLKARAAKTKPSSYGTIANDFIQVARALGIPPSQFQATLWWTYKRILGIRFDYQIDLW